MSETTEQAKHARELFSLPRLKEAKRILGSPNRAYELLNLIGVRDKLLEDGNWMRTILLQLEKHLMPEERQRLIAVGVNLAKAEGR